MNVLLVVAAYLSVILATKRLRTAGDEEDEPASKRLAVYEEDSQLYFPVEIPMRIANLDRTGEFGIVLSMTNKYFHAKFKRMSLRYCAFTSHFGPKEPTRIHLKAALSHLEDDKLLPDTDKVRFLYYMLFLFREYSDKDLIYSTLLKMNFSDDLKRKTWDPQGMSANGLVTMITIMPNILLTCSNEKSYPNLRLFCGDEHGQEMLSVIVDTYLMISFKTREIGDAYKETKDNIGAFLKAIFRAETMEEWKLMKLKYIAGAFQLVHDCTLDPYMIIFLADLFNLPVETCEENTEIDLKDWINESQSPQFFYHVLLTAAGLFHHGQRAQNWAGANLKAQTKFSKLLFCFMESLVSPDLINNWSVAKKMAIICVYQTIRSDDRQKFLIEKMLSEDDVVRNDFYRAFCSGSNIGFIRTVFKNQLMLLMEDGESRRLLERFTLTNFRHLNQICSQENTETILFLQQIVEQELYNIIVKMDEEYASKYVACMKLGHAFTKLVIDVISNSESLMKYMIRLKAVLPIDALNKI